MKKRMRRPVGILCHVFKRQLIALVFFIDSVDEKYRYSKDFFAKETLNWFYFVLSLLDDISLRFS